MYLAWDLVFNRVDKKGERPFFLDFNTTAKNTSREYFLLYILCYYSNILVLIYFKQLLPNLFLVS